MVKYSVVEIGTNKIIESEVWAKSDAIEMAKKAKADSKGKKEYYVIQSAQVFTTIEEVKDLAFF